MYLAGWLADWQLRSNANLPAASILTVPRQRRSVAHKVLYCRAPGGVVAHIHLELSNAVFHPHDLRAGAGG
eukprot:365754-Chlamydomonas_euryale.AAC.13